MKPTCGVVRGLIKAEKMCNVALAKEVRGYFGRMKMSKSITYFGNLNEREVIWGEDGWRRFVERC